MIIKTFLSIAIMMNILFFMATIANAADTTPPSQPKHLEVLSKGLNSLQIQWIGSGDDEREGKAAGYIVKKSTKKIRNIEDWTKATDVSFRLKSKPAEKQIRIYIGSMTMGDKGFIAVRAFDDNQNFSTISNNIRFEIADPFTSLNANFTKDIDQAWNSGYEADQSPIYACVSYVSGALIPGKYWGNWRGCHSVVNEREVEYRTFRFVKDTADQSWQAAEGGKIPEAGVIYGRNQQQLLFICRGPINDGVHIGFTQKGQKGCIVPWGGVKHTLDVFDVLVTND